MVKASALWVFKPRISRYCTKRVPAGMDPEDMVMGIFEQAIKAAPRFYIPEGRLWNDVVWGWLIRITKNALVDSYRKAKPATVPLEDFHAVVLDAPEREYALKEDRERLANAIRHLPTEAQRMVIAARFVAGMNLRETGALLDIAPESVKSLQWRALENMRRDLKGCAKDLRECFKCADLYEEGAIMCPTLEERMRVMGPPCLQRTSHGLEWVFPGAKAKRVPV
jgi:RNA polymerase sigma factor (sigma-70 family)